MGAKNQHIKNVTKHKVRNTTFARLNKDTFISLDSDTPAILKLESEFRENLHFSGIELFDSKKYVVMAWYKKYIKGYGHCSQQLYFLLFPYVIFQNGKELQKRIITIF